MSDGWGVGMVADSNDGPVLPPPVTPIPPPVIPPATLIFDTFDRVTSPGYELGAGAPSSGTNGDYQEDGPFHWFPGPYGPTDEYAEAWCDGALLNMAWHYMDNDQLEMTYPPTFEPPLESPVLDLLDSDCVFTTRFRTSEIGFELPNGYGDPASYRSSLRVRVALQGWDTFFAVTVFANGNGVGSTQPGRIMLSEVQWSQYFYMADRVTFDPDSAMGKTDWVANTWYTIKVDWQPSILFAQAKVWADGDAEPGWMVRGYAPASAPSFVPTQYAFFGLKRDTEFSDLDTATDMHVQVDDLISVTP